MRKMVPSFVVVAVVFVAVVVVVVEIVGACQWSGRRKVKRRTDERRPQAPQQGRCPRKPWFAIKEE
jgi:hypothetical protein